MNEGLEVLMTRRSIRSYTDEPVGDDDLEEILRTAMAAPSAGNQQPWHFVVIRDRAVMEEIMKVHPYSSMLSEAPVCIAVVADTSLEKHRGYWVQDCAAATQNILLAARALGLGTCWLGVHPRKDRVEGVAQILNLPEDAICLSLVALGHPAEEKGRADRYNPDRIHNETW